MPQHHLQEVINASNCCLTTASGLFYHWAQWRPLASSAHYGYEWIASWWRGEACRQIL
jgi:hypothetical protein